MRADGRPRQARPDRAKAAASHADGGDPGPGDGPGHTAEAALQEVDKPPDEEAGERDPAGAAEGGERGRPEAGRQIDGEARRDGGGGRDDDARPAAEVDAGEGAEPETAAASDGRGESRSGVGGGGAAGAR